MHVRLRLCMDLPLLHLSLDLCSNVNFMCHFAMIRMLDLCKPFPRASPLPRHFVDTFMHLFLTDTIDTHRKFYVQGPWDVSCLRGTQRLPVGYLMLPTRLKRGAIREIGNHLDCFGHGPWSVFTLQDPSTLSSSALIANAIETRDKRWNRH